jgi:hypothetical protein
MYIVPHLNVIKEEVDIGRHLLSVVGECNSLQAEWALELFTSTVHLIEMVNEISVHR